MISKDDILEYGYCDEQDNYIAVLNKEKLKEIFNANIIRFDDDPKEKVHL